MQLICYALAGFCLSHQAVWADNNFLQECLLDLQALPAFILNNDSGGKDSLTAGE